MNLKQKSKMSILMACTMAVSLAPSSLSANASSNENIIIYENNFESGKIPDEVSGVITKDDISVESIGNGNNALKFASKFDGTGSWENNKHEIAFYKNYKNKISKGAILQFDILIPSDKKSYNGKIKYIGGLGTHDTSTDNWGWVSTSYGDINSYDFIDLGNGFSSKSVTLSLNNDVNIDLYKVDLQILSYNCNYRGDIYIDNFKLMDKVNEGYKYKGNTSKEMNNMVNPALVDDFESYGDDDLLLQKSWETKAENGCAVNPKLVKDGTGNHDLELNYKISTAKAKEGWVGITKTKKTDWSKYNSLQFWCTPDGKGQKLIIQITSNGEDFEANLSEIADTSEERLITIPFADFKGKNGGVLDLARIERVGIWCKTIAKNTDESCQVDSKMYFDDIKAVY